MGLSVALLGSGCGGGATPGAENPENNGSGGGAGASDGSGPQASGPTGPDCSDGTCALCGEGICPTGFYCDESAPEGPACQWLPECPEEASCGCVSGALGDACQCTERDGGVFVSCS